MISRKSDSGAYIGGVWRDYATVGDLLDCDYVETDAGFTCCRPGPKSLINPDAGVFAFRCYGSKSPPRWWEFWRWFERPKEWHDLDGQLNEDGRYVGVFPRFDLNADRF